MAALAVPAMAAALQWNPMLHLLSADLFGLALLAGTGQGWVIRGRSR